MKISQKGFTAIEGLLIVIILAIIGGTGYYVYHSKQQADKNLTAAQNEQVVIKSNSIKTFADCQKATGSMIQTTYPEVCVTKSGQHFTQPAASSGQTYLTIKEWGVRAAYSGSLHLLYQFRTNQSNIADFTSQEMLNLDSDCSYESGGLIARYTASDTADTLQSGPDNMTVGQYIAQDTQSDYSHIGNYYYFYDRSEAGCGSDVSKTAALQSQTSDAVKSLIANLQAVPQ